MDIVNLDQENKDYREEALRISGSLIVSRGRMHHLAELAGFCAVAEDKVQGCIFYRIEGNACEIVSLESRIENIGAGTALIDKVIDAARFAGCTKVWLITSNDNTRAIRFYQKRGFDLIAVHKDAITEARKLKPSIPLFGYDGIPVRHEVEFELLL